MLRQFHQEGFVNQFAVMGASSPKTIIFESEALENVPRGWRVRETYEIVSVDEFVETFEIASTADFEVYSVIQAKALGVHLRQSRGMEHRPPAHR